MDVTNDLYDIQNELHFAYILQVTIDIGPKLWDPICVMYCHILV